MLGGTLWSIISLFEYQISGGSKGGPKFFQFHAVYGKIWQNRMLAPCPLWRVGALPPLEGWRPHLWKFLDPPLLIYHFWNILLTLAADENCRSLSYRVEVQPLQRDTIRIFFPIFLKKILYS